MSRQPGRRLTAFRALFTGDFRSLIAAQALGGLGEWLATMALIGLVWERTHSAFASGIVLALRILPAACVSSLLGLLVDRFDRRTVLIVCTAARACIYASLPLVGGVAAVLALAFVAEIGTLAYAAARDATMPKIVPSESLPTANAVSMASGFAAMPFGSGLFAGLVWIQGWTGRDGIGLALLTSGLLLGFATILLRRLASHAEVAAPRDGGTASREDVLHPAGPGVSLRAVFARDPVLRRVALGGTIVACCGGSLLTLGLVYVRSTLHAGPAAYSGLLTTFCAGAIAGMFALHRRRAQMPRLFHLASLLMGAILLTMAVFPSKPVGFAMGFVFGACFVATFLGGITILQDRVHDEVRGRAFALAHSGLRVGAVVVGLVAAWGAKRLGVGTVLWTMDGTQVVLAAAGLTIAASSIMLFPRRAAAAA